MQVIWELLLTVCLYSECKTQSVQLFDYEYQCEHMRELVEEIPKDGHWTSVNYLCKPQGSFTT